MGEPTFNPNVLSFTEDKLDALVAECGLDADTIHPVVSTMFPRNNMMAEDFVRYWCDIKNNVRGGEAGLQFSINSTDDEQRDKQFSRNIR